MKSIPYDELGALLGSFKREALHLEMRDAYGTEVELPHLRKWLAGEPDNAEWLQPWFDKVRAGTEAGKIFRRARVVSEPVTEYQRWILNDSHLFIEAGEDIRWVPRRLVSTIALPGNDFWLFDDELVVFLIFSGNGLVLDRKCSGNPWDLGGCTTADLGRLVDLPRDDRILTLDRLATDDPEAIRLCRSAFEAVWKLSIPNSEYKPN